MRVGSLAAARPAFYDRNAAGNVASYGATVAPHGVTTRWTITIAAGKKAFSELLVIYMERNTAATTPGTLLGIWQCNSGTFVNQYSTSNTVGYVSSQTYTPTTTLYAGETSSALTADGSSGATPGTVTFVINFKYTTFDA